MTLRCRHCKVPLRENEGVFLTPLNNPSRYASCPECYERSILRSSRSYIEGYNLQREPGTAGMEYHGSCFGD